MIQTADKCGGRAHGRRSLEDLLHSIAAVHGSDRIRDIEFGDRGVVIPDDFEQQPVQRSPEERRIAWRDQHEVAPGRPEAFVEPLDRPATLAHIMGEDNAREDGPNLRFSFRTTDGHDRLVGEGRHRMRDVGDERATRDLHERLAAPESTGFATREDERRVHGDPIVPLPVKAREGKISRSDFRRIVASRR